MLPRPEPLAPDPSALSTGARGVELRWSDVISSELSKHGVRDMARERIVSADQPEDNGRERDASLRPRWLREVIGQQKVVQQLKVVLNASRKLKEPIAHILFDGPPGLGKTTF